jgi:hypothetical protein
METHLLGTEFFHAYGHRDMTKLIVFFRNFAKVPKKTELASYLDNWCYLLL